MILAEARTRVTEALERLTKILEAAGVSVESGITFIDRDFREYAEPQGIVEAMIGTLTVSMPELEDGEELRFSVGAEVDRTGHIKEEDLDAEIATVTGEVTEFAEAIADASDKAAFLHEKIRAAEELDREAALEVGKRLKKMKVTQAVLILLIIAGVLIFALISRLLGK